MKQLSALLFRSTENLLHLKSDASFECIEWTEFLVLPDTVGESKIQIIDYFPL